MYISRNLDFPYLARQINGIVRLWRGSTVTSGKRAGKMYSITHRHPFSCINNNPVETVHAVVLILSRVTRTRDGTRSSTPYICGSTADFICAEKNGYIVCNVCAMMYLSNFYQVCLLMKKKQACLYQP